MKEEKDHMSEFTPRPAEPPTLAPLLTMTDIEVNAIRGHAEAARDTFIMTRLSPSLVLRLLAELAAQRAEVARLTAEVSNLTAALRGVHGIELPNDDDTTTTVNMADLEHQVELGYEASARASQAEADLAALRARETALREIVEKWRDEANQWSGGERSMLLSSANELEAALKAGDGPRHTGGA